MNVLSAADQAISSIFGNPRDLEKLIGKSQYLPDTVFERYHVETRNCLKEMGMVTTNHGGGLAVRITITRRYVDDYVERHEKHDQ